MTIEPGTRVGVYEIREQLGEGGMGAVYRASDSRLKRDVAIKVIRQDLAADADRAARFEREARLLASLNHPHIAVVHGLEQADDVRLLVLELVPGDTLAERLNNGPLAVHEALGFAMQIASGIEAAHDRGIVHRDLKPANIKITPSGAVKILDFGLAKALSSDSTSDLSAASATLTADGTAEGVILGTAAFMSPEQARGKEIDKRTDIWAFGCVLYDMLVGRTPFAGRRSRTLSSRFLLESPTGHVCPPIRHPQRAGCCSAACKRTRRVDCAISAMRGSTSRKRCRGNRQQKRPRENRQATDATRVTIVAALMLGAALSAAAIWALSPATTRTKTDSAIRCDIA